jgi:hypothetical protein
MPWQRCGVIFEIPINAAALPVSMAALVLVVEA